MNKTKYQRPCPQCKKIVEYSRKDSLDRANKENRKCSFCSIHKGSEHYRFGKQVSEEIKEKIRKSKVGIPIHSVEHKQKLRERWSGENNPSKKHPPFLGRKHSEETKKRMSEIHSGKNYGRVGKKHPMFGKTFSELSKQKMRLSRIAYLLKTKDRICPNYSLNACMFFDQLERQNSLDGFYASKNKEFYIKELGYWVDYYEPNLNLVIEYDEAHHFVGGKLRERDYRRMSLIVNLLKCSFYRFNSQTKELINFYPSDVLKPINVICPTV